MNKKLKKQIHFLITSSVMILLSIIGFVIFLITKWIGIYPTVYILMFMIGIGWGTTALIGIQRIRQGHKR